MVLEILRVEPIYPQYSGVLETCLAMRYWFFEVLGSESVKKDISEKHDNEVFYYNDLSKCFGMVPCSLKV